MGADDASASSTPRPTGSGPAEAGRSRVVNLTAPAPTAGGHIAPLLLGFTGNRRMRGCCGKDTLLGPQADDVAALTSNNKG